MKKGIGVLTATLLLIVFCIYSCNKSESVVPTVKQDVSFSFTQKGLKNGSAENLKLSFFKEDAKYVVVTIEKSNGEKVYESKQLELFNFGGSFISQSISLVVNETSYKLTEFLVLDKNSSAIFATPLEGSALAYLVADPLPISFTVNINQITKVVPEVLSTELGPIKDFGYASFDYNVITPIRFLIGVHRYNPYSKNWEPTNANVLIKGNPGDSILLSDSVATTTEAIIVKDGYENYKISISKTGYIGKDTILTNVQLKTYLSNPLIFLLKNETVTDIDGNVYKTVTIGTQVWMAENLKVTRYRSGDPISGDAYSDPHGILYSWHAVADNRNIAPAGWHVPTDADWTLLTTYLGGTGIAGGKLKEAGTAHWKSPNTGATNETGFTALPYLEIMPASRPIELQFDPSIYCYWWSSTIDINGCPMIRRLHYGYPDMDKGPLPFGLINVTSLAVRCIKD